MLTPYKNRVFLSLFMRGYFFEHVFLSLINIEVGIKIINHYLSQKPCSMQLCEMFRNVWKPVSFCLSFSAFSFPYYEGLWFWTQNLSVKSPARIISMLHNPSRTYGFSCGHSYEIVKNVDKKCRSNPYISERENSLAMWYIKSEQHDRNHLACYPHIAQRHIKFGGAA